MAPFKLCRRDPSKTGMAPTRVVPTLDVREYGESSRGLGLEAAPVEQFALKAGEEAFRHRIVVGVADAAHRWPHAEVAAALAEGDAGVLRTLVAVMNDAVRFPLRDGHVQRGQYQVGRHVFADRPADDPPTPYVEHDGQKDEAGPGRHVGHVGDPQLIGTRGSKFAVDQIRCRTLMGIALCRHYVAPPPRHATQARLAHQSGDPLTAHPCAFLA